jgi:cation:H+ antiporter
MLFIQRCSLFVNKVMSSTVGMAGGAISALWTFPSVLFSAIIIAWGAEAAQFLISQGLALAILAWLQTLPEFAVEAVIAWQAGKPGGTTHLMTANFTGSLRLLVGLGWPMVYATAAYFYKKKNKKPLGHIELEREHAVEVVSLAPPILYFFFIYFKGSLDWYDSIVLMVFYAVYLVFLNKIPPQSSENLEDMERVPRYILSQKPRVRNAIITGLFVSGGLILYFVAHPFLESMKGLALSMGISTFVFVQWVSPFMSEFPEKVSAFYWARKVTGAPMALMNLVSSNINQWTMLIAMLPIAYAFAHGGFRSIEFDDHQRLEIILTIAQSLLGMLLLANMRFHWWEALLLFGLWLIQFMASGFERPAVVDAGMSSGLTDWAEHMFSIAKANIENTAHAVKIGITVIYFGWSAVEFGISLKDGGPQAVRVFRQIVKEYW